MIMDSDDYTENSNFPLWFEVEERLVKTGVTAGHILSLGIVIDARYDIDILIVNDLIYTWISREKMVISTKSMTCLC